VNDGITYRGLRSIACIAEGEKNDREARQDEEDHQVKRENESGLEQVASTLVLPEKT
jgi:hypothetical protein